jgi:hypothetical protein
MMAAATAAGAGLKVVLLEKNRVLGKKLSITGGGRCNVTNNKPVVREMLSQYKTEGKFLFSPFMQHGVTESISWFTDKGVPFIEENEGRLFPHTQSAQTITDTMVNELNRTGVIVRLSVAVESVKPEAGGFVVQCQNGEVVSAKKCIVATGGTARPETGSTGEGFSWLQTLGHTVVENSFALVPLTIRDAWAKRLSGIAIKTCKITIVAEGKKLSAQTGKLLFTHVGVTGPTILNMSKTVGEFLLYGPVTLLLDLFPGVDSQAMNTLFSELFTRNNNKKVRNAFSELLPTALVKELLLLVDIDGETQCNAILREQRLRLLGLVKAVPLQVSGLLGKDKAVVSAGGVRLEEVNFKTMESKVVPGLFLVGDVLNINRPSGGYSLQLCWTTGFVAGSSAAKNH